MFLKCNGTLLKIHFKEAKRLYEEVIEDESRTVPVESATRSTLGWMLFRCEDLGEKESRIRKAIQGGIKFRRNKLKTFC